MQPVRGQGRDLMFHVRHAGLPALLPGARAALPRARAAEPAPPAVPQPAPENAQLLSGASSALKAGNAEAAIRDFLDPLLAKFDAQVKPEGPRLYSATT